MTEPSTDDSNQPSPPTKNRSKAMLLFTLLLLILGAAWLLYWYEVLRYYEATDDAYVNGNMVSLNPIVSGPVVAFFADNTDLVEEGQLLATIDSTQYRIAYERELATLASVVLQVRQLYDAVETQKAIVASKKAIVNRAKFDYENRLQIYNTNPKALSNEDFIHSRDNLHIVESDLRQAEAQLQAALAAAGPTAPQNHPLIEKQKAIAEMAFYQLQHCSIYAPMTGYVAQRSIEVGKWISPTTPLMAIISNESMWVDANFKETQLQSMRIGQPAKVWFDYYGSKAHFDGKVIGIACGTGSVFSLIPPQNATGNWIKIVQRLPVRIALNSDQLRDYPLRLGISADVEVDISNTDLPMLAQTPSTKPVGRTEIFDIHLREAKEAMDKIITENLGQKDDGT